MDRRKATIVIWAVITVVFFAGLACAAFLVPASTSAGTIDQPANAALNPLGAALFYSGAPGQPSPPPAIDPRSIQGLLIIGDKGQMRFEGLKYFKTQGAPYVMYLCNSSLVDPSNLPGVSTAELFVKVTSVCLRCPIVLQDAKQDPFGALVYEGTYNFAYEGTYNLALAVGIPPAPYIMDPKIYDAYNKSVVAVALLEAQRIFSLTAIQYGPNTRNGTGGNSGSSQTDPRAVFARGYDTAQMFLLFALFLLTVTFISMMLTWERRVKQTITILVLGCVSANCLMVILQSAVDFQKDISCTVRGFFQHFTACSMLAWYTLSSIHFYCALVGGGKNAEYAFGASTKVTLVYLLCGFGFVIVDCAIVWGLYPLNASYGPMFPRAFCWVRTETLWTLGFSFYVPAVIALVVNLVLSVMTIRFILKVRSSLDKVDKDTMIAVIALFGCSNVGTIGFGFLGLFVALYRNANGGNPAIFIVLSVFLFVQALVYWLVYFARPASMEIWSRLFFCNGFRDLQEPGSRLPTMSSDNSSRSTTALKASSATSTASADVASIEL